ncbi:MAG: hypothetical protein Q8O40_14890 [Chloroflexota bacterium]|nr:hypothetical protein [Chloroflexota bacterium]
MSGKAFLGLLIAVILLGGGLGGAYIGGYTLGERKGKSQAEASASQSATQNLQQMREQFQSQLGQGGQVQGLQGTPQPGGQGRTGAGALMGGGQVGTIQKIENGKLTLNTTRGALEATLSQNTTVEMTSTGAVSDLKVGMQVAVVGQQDSSGVLQARSVTVVPVGTGTGGFFGGLGGGGATRQGATPTPQQR